MAFAEISIGSPSEFADSKAHATKLADTKYKINFWYVIAAMALLLLFESWWLQQQQVETIPFSHSKLSWMARRSKTCSWRPITSRAR